MTAADPCQRGLLRPPSALVTIGTSTVAETTWGSPEQLTVEPGLHVDLVQRRSLQMLSIQGERPSLKS